MRVSKAGRVPHTKPANCPSLTKTQTATAHSAISWSRSSPCLSVGCCGLSCHIFSGEAAVFKDLIACCQLFVSEWKRRAWIANVALLSIHLSNFWRNFYGIRRHQARIKLHPAATRHALPAAIG